VPERVGAGGGSGDDEIFGLEAQADAIVGRNIFGIEIELGVAGDRA